MCARRGLGSAVPPVGLGAGCKDVQAGLCQAWVLGQLLGHADFGGPGHSCRCQNHRSKASILRRSAFFTVQLSHPYMATGKTIALTRQTFYKGTNPSPKSSNSDFYHIRD